MDRQSFCASAGAARWRRGYLAAGAAALAAALGIQDCSQSARNDSSPPATSGPGLVGVRIRSAATDRCVTAVPQPSAGDSPGNPDPGCAEERCLAAAPGELVVVVTGCATDSPFQRWDLVPEGEDHHAIRMAGSGEEAGEVCLTLGVPEPGAAPTLNPCDGSPSQRWSLVEVPGCRSGTSYVIALGGQHLEAGSGGPGVHVAPSSGEPLQQWQFVP